MTSTTTPSAGPPRGPDPGSARHSPPWPRPFPQTPAPAFQGDEKAPRPEKRTATVGGALPQPPQLRIPLRDQGLFITLLAPQPETLHVTQEPEDHGLPGPTPGPFGWISAMGTQTLPSPCVQARGGKGGGGGGLHQQDPSHRRGLLVPRPGLQRAADGDVHRVRRTPVTHIHTPPRERNPPATPIVPSAPAGHSTAAI